MKGNWLFLFILLGFACMARPPLSFAQEDSAKQGEQVISLDHAAPGISPPRAIYSPEPEYDDASRKAKRSGEVVLSLVVTKEGAAEDVKVIKSLSPGLDRRAVAAVSSWKFAPATKGGDPIPVRIKVEVRFRIR